jgi:hypothetical protein
MDSEIPFNLMIFTDSTKKICTCSAISMFLIVLFIITPLSNFFITSSLMKIVVLIILAYTIYLNTLQINSLRTASSFVKSENVMSQLNINIMCSYIFTLFLGLLCIFVIKTFL